MDSTIALLADLVVIIGALLATGTILLSGVRNVWRRFAPGVERFGVNALMVLIVVVSLAINVNMLMVVSSIGDRLSVLEDQIGTVEDRLTVVDNRLTTVGQRVHRIELLLNPVD